MPLVCPTLPCVWPRGDLTLKLMEIILRHPSLARAWPFLRHYGPSDDGFICFWINSKNKIFFFFLVLFPSKNYLGNFVSWILPDQGLLSVHAWWISRLYNQIVNSSNSRPGLAGMPGIMWACQGRGAFTPGITARCRENCKQDQSSPEENKLWTRCLVARVPSSGSKCHRCLFQSLRNINRLH